MDDATQRKAASASRRARIDLLLLFLILATALLLRVSPLLGGLEAQRNGLGPFGDSWAYHAIGYNLAQGNGYSMTDFGGAKGLGVNPPDPQLYLPAATRAPLYPIFLAGIYKANGLTGQLSALQMQMTFRLVRVIQAILDTATCLMLFLLARLLTPRWQLPALFSAAIYATSPYHGYFSGAILTETLASFLAVAAILVTTRAMRDVCSWAFGAGGILWGLLALCRPEYLILSVTLAVVLAVVHWRRSVRFTPVLALVAGIALAVAPWIARNQTTFGSPFISVGGLGYNLFWGSFEGRHPLRKWDELPKEIFLHPNEHQQAQLLVDDFLSASRQGSVAIRTIDQQFFDLAVERIRADPAGTLADWILKLPRLGYQDRHPLYRDPEPHGAYALACLILGAIGAFVLWRRRVSWALPAMAFVPLVWLMYLPLHVEPRYGLPMLAVVIAFAGVGSGVLWSTLASLRRGSPMIPPHGP